MYYAILHGLANKHRIKKNNEPLKSRVCQFDNFVLTGGTGNCDNFWCHQWRQNCQIDIFHRNCRVVLQKHRFFKFWTTSIIYSTGNQFFLSFDIMILYVCLVHILSHFSEVYETDSFRVDRVIGSGLPWTHDDVIKWKHFPRYWPFVRGIHRSPVNSPHKGQWRGALMFTLIYVWINGCVSNRAAGDLRRYCAHYGVTVMPSSSSSIYSIVLGPRPLCYVISIGCGDVRIKMTS